MAASPERSWSLPATADQVPQLRRAVTVAARDAGLGGERLDALRLAVTEAAANAVMHAYRDRSEPGSLRVSVAVDGAELVVELADDGGGPEPRRDSPGAGLGLPLIAEIVDGFAVRATPEGGTRVTLRFQLDGGARTAAS